MKRRERTQKPFIHKDLLKEKAMLQQLMSTNLHL